MCEKCKTPLDLVVNHTCMWCGVEVPPLENERGELEGSLVCDNPKCHPERENDEPLT